MVELFELKTIASLLFNSLVYFVLYHDQELVYVDIYQVNLFHALGELFFVVHKHVLESSQLGGRRCNSILCVAKDYGIDLVSHHGGPCDERLRTHLNLKTFILCILSY